MKRIGIFFICIAALCVPQYVAAQAYSAPAGEFFRQEGIGSWYGPGFDGRPTASGEIFDSSQFTAAHPNLPFGTFLLITNRHNNRQVTVRVNDRGPFVASRIIDVSKAAAEHLDMIITGTAPVIVETLQSSHLPSPQQVPVNPEVQVYTQAAIQQPQNPVAQPQPQIVQVQPVVQVQPQQPQQFTVVESAPAISTTILESYQAPPPPETVSTQARVSPSPEVLPPPPASGVKFIPAIEPLPGRVYKLQVGSFKDPRSAVAAYERLKDAGLGPSYERYGDFYRVVLTGIRGAEVKAVADKLDTAGFREAIIREE